MEPIEPSPEPITASLLAQGDGWRAQSVICRSGPGDRAFEERHDWTSVALVLSGGFTYRTEAGRAVMAPGAVLLGNAGRCFECGHQHGTGDHCVLFHFSPDFTEDLARELGRGARTDFRRPSLPPLDHLAPLLAEARALARAPDPLRAEQLALSMATAALTLDQEATAKAPCAADEARIAQAARMIETRHTEPLTLAGLADAVGLSRRRFATAFRRVLGVTPYNYILSHRLQAAAERLSHSSDSVLDIALDAGFGDLSEFTRRFRAKFGRPPGAYRRAITQS